jgi:hypothetical protein
MDLVLPVCSNRTPRVVPNIIINASDFIILPNPSFAVVSTSAIESWQPRPTTKQASKSAKKAGILYLEVRTMITPIPASKKVSICQKDII